MIGSIRLERFKCFEELSLPLAPFTLLAGLNAAGKSTTLQTLLVIAQTFRDKHDAQYLRLNGPLASLGTATDVVNGWKGGNAVALGFGTDVGEVLWRFSTSNSGNRALKLSAVETKEGDNVERVLSYAHAELQRVIFLSAARQVETELFPVPQDLERIVGDVGAVGQFAAYWFDQNADDKVPAERCVDAENGEAGTVRRQLNAWVSELFPGVEINAVQVSRTSFLRMELRSGILDDWARPANIGYGITYLFPILVACLTAKVGSTLIIDSPEAHLHPAAQARIGGFLVQMAASGLQILLETHSDHVMDGARIAIREGVISPNSALFHYFSREDGKVSISSPEIDSEGRLSTWPSGFFDQHRRNTARLIRPRGATTE